MAKKAFLSILGLVLLSPCTFSQKGNIMHKIFGEENVGTIDQVIDYYDQFILSKTDSEPDIEKAYIRYLENICPIIQNTADLGPLIPEEDSKIEFFNTLDKQDLSVIYYFEDSADYYDPNTNQFTTVKVPYFFMLNSVGPYLTLLKKLSKRDAFYKQYYTDIMNSRDISPLIYASLLDNYHRIDFSKREERLTFIVPFLFYNPIHQF